MGWTAAAMLPKQVRGTFRKHVTKPPPQPAAPDCSSIEKLVILVCNAIKAKLQVNTYSYVSVIIPYKTRNLTGTLYDPFEPSSFGIPCADRLAWSSVRSEIKLRTDMHEGRQERAWEGVRRLAISQQHCRFDTAKLRSLDWGYVKRRKNCSSKL